MSVHQGTGPPGRSIWVGVRSCWRRPLARGGLLRWGAQKQKRERQQRPGRPLGEGNVLCAGGHEQTLTPVPRGLQVGRIRF
jgi:hypothetical protein